LGTFFATVHFAQLFSIRNPQSAIRN